MSGRGLINAWTEDASYVSLSAGERTQEWLRGKIGMWLLPSDGLPSEGIQRGKQIHLILRHPMPKFQEQLRSWGLGEHREGSEKAPERRYLVVFSKALVGVCQAEKMGVGKMVYVEGPAEIQTWRDDISCILGSSGSFHSQLIKGCGGKHLEMRWTKWAQVRSRRASNAMRRNRTSVPSALEMY